MHLIEFRASADGLVRVLAVEGAKHDSVDLFQQHADILIRFIHDNLQSAPR